MRKTIEMQFIQQKICNKMKQKHPKIFDAD